ncbi:hypothetical protein EC988_006757 [Linderina pennispora]|nr:hypothetical protein EC988_006757 [Linderina pennispora]
MATNSISFKFAHQAAVGLGIYYLFAVVNSWQTVKYAVKPTTTLLIAYPTISGSRTAFYGLLLSTLGDIFLMIPREDMFVPGLLSFLVAHILYISAFSARWRMSWSIVPLSAYSAIMVNLLYPGIAKEEAAVQIGVVVYVLVITAMVYKASLTGSGTLIFGTILFAISDSVLAWNKFIAVQQWGEFTVMLTYYAAQLCISLVHC